MSKEETLELCRGIDEYLCSGNPIWDVDKIHEAMTTAIEALETQKTGYWKDNHVMMTYRYGCSECGAYHRAMYDYCPTCGAKMYDNEESERDYKVKMK